MTIETSFERIAMALETLTVLMSKTMDLTLSDQGLKIASTPVIQAEMPLPQPVPADDKGDQPQKPRGRPRKEKPAQIDIEEAVKDDFLADAPAAEPAKTVTKDDLRNALVAYSKQTDAKTAKAVMKEKGGSELLGEIPEDKYQVVYDEVKRLTKPTGDGK